MNVVVVVVVGVKEMWVLRGRLGLGGAKVEMGMHTLKGCCFRPVYIRMPKPKMCKWGAQPKWSQKSS